MDINYISNKFKFKYYNNILQYINKNNMNADWISSYINNLQVPIIDEILTDQTTEMKSEIMSTSIKTENHNQIFSDDNLYKKPWTKLNSIHKILKIKEFVNNCKFNSEEERIKLIDNLVMLVKNKILTKKEKVKYDEVSGKLISLTDLEYKNGTYSYPSC